MPSSYLYPTGQHHPTPLAHPIIVLSLSDLSKAQSTLSDQEIFDDLLRGLDPYVDEEGKAGAGYVLVVMAAEEGGVESKSRSGISWWAWKWRSVPRRYRKSLKRLYLIHPTLFTRTLIPLIIPFVSLKAYNKFYPLQSIFQLHSKYGVSLKGMSLTMAVIHEESRVITAHPDLIPKPKPKPKPKLNSTASSPTAKGKAKTLDFESTGEVEGGWGLTSTIYGTVRSFLSYPYASGSSSTTLSRSTISSDSHSGLGSVYLEDEEAEGYWHRSAEDLLFEGGGRVPLVDELCAAILQECGGTEGIFRRTSNSSLLPLLTALLALPIDQQPTIPWIDIAQHDPLLPPKMILRFLSHLASPVISPDLYPAIRRVTTLDDLKSFLPLLPKSSRTLLQPLITALHTLSASPPDPSSSGDTSSTNEVSHKAQMAGLNVTKMSSTAFAIVLAPALIRGPDVLEDAAMCMIPGKGLPTAISLEYAKATGGEKAAIRHGNGYGHGKGEDEGARVEKGKGKGTVVGMLDLWIRGFEEI